MQTQYVGSLGSTGRSKSIPLAFVAAVDEPAAAVASRVLCTFKNHVYYNNLAKMKGWNNKFTNLSWLSDKSKCKSSKIVPLKFGMNLFLYVGILEGWKWQHESCSKES